MVGHRIRTNDVPVFVARELGSKCVTNLLLANGPPLIEAAHYCIGTDRELVEVNDFAREFDQMEAAQSLDRGRLTMPVRARNGKVRFGETPEILWEVENLGRRMLLVRFDDGATTFLFAHEVATA
jgi:hypothetical protein